MQHPPNHCHLPHAARCWIAAAWLAATSGTLSVLADEHSMDVDGSVAFQSLAASKLGHRFLQEADAARSSIPERVWRGIRQAGWRIRLSEFVVDAAPHLRNVRPRGWPTDFTWKHTDSVLLPSARLLVLAEKRLRRTGEVVCSDRVAGVFRHELGHAFDMVAGRPYRFRSSGPDFVEAYAHDVVRLSTDEREPLLYYLQSRPAGWQETFAEAFAVTLGGGSDVTKRQPFEQAFPSVLERVQRDIDEFVP